MLESINDKFGNLDLDDKVISLFLIMVFLSMFIVGYVGTKLFSNDLTRQIITTRYERRNY